MTQLFGIAGEIEEAIGLEMAVVLLRAKGGTEISIPVQADGSALAALIGVEATQKLIDAMGAGRLTLPMAGLRGAEAERRARREKALHMLKDGASLTAVAHACELNVRTVSNYRAELDDRQGELPI